MRILQGSHQETIQGAAAIALSAALGAAAFWTVKGVLVHTLVGGAVGACASAIALLAHKMNYSMPLNFILIVGGIGAIGAQIIGEPITNGMAIAFVAANFTGLINYLGLFHYGKPA